jgi:2-polyprenyl-6-methoxyphenol hydroxylase-like FAD-dependent oxidoreductase
MSTGHKPTVLIVGAGLGGLMLGTLLEKSNVPYAIFERAAAVKPLGMKKPCALLFCIAEAKNTWLACYDLLWASPLSYLSS